MDSHVTGFAKAIWRGPGPFRDKGRLLLRNLHPRNVLTARRKRRVDHATGTRGKRPKSSTPVHVAGKAVPKPVEMPPAQLSRSQRAGNADTPTATVAEPSKKAEGASGPAVRTIRDQVAAATALAERLSSATAAPAPELKSDNGDLSNRSDPVRPRDTETTGSASSTASGPLVALLMARPEINSVSDLANKEIAIEDNQSASNGNLRTAIAAAGAVEVQLSDGHTKAIDRLLSGEVPAAVLTLVSPDAAAVFPDIAGFKTFRIPLSATSDKAHL